MDKVAYGCWTVNGQPYVFRWDPKCPVDWGVNCPNCRRSLGEATVRWGTTRERGIHRPDGSDIGGFKGSSQRCLVELRVCDR